MFENRDDQIFFGIGFLVALIVLLLPTAVLRMLSYGRYKEGDIPAWNIKFLRVCAGVIVVSSTIELLRHLFG
jgi:hypothetical protein